MARLPSFVQRLHLRTRVSRNAVLLGALAAVGLGIALARQGNEHTTVTLERADPPAGVVTVDVVVSGAVLHPGTVSLPTGSTMADVLAAVGGANVGHIATLNLTRRVEDGERLTVPGTAPLRDLNTMSLRELEALPGIGPSTAAAIVGARVQPFRSTDELVTRHLLPLARYRAIRDLVTARPVGTAP